MLLLLSACFYDLILSYGVRSGFPRTMTSFRVQLPEKFDFSHQEEWLKWSRRFERFRQVSGLAIVLPKLTYGLPVYASSIPELTTVQNFLQRCFQRKYVSYRIDIYGVLEEVDRSLFKKISGMPGHPLYPSVPKMKESSARLRVPSSQLPKVNPQCFKNSFFLTGFFSNIE